MAPQNGAEGLSAAELREAWRVLSLPERAEGFRMLERPESEEFYVELDAHDQAELNDGSPRRRAALLDAAAGPR